MCSGSVAKACDDGNPCTSDACDPVSGQCSAKPSDGKLCDDGLPCTLGDLCSAGQCQAGEDACSCKQNADCPDDGNLSNGKLFCDKSGLPWACKILPGSAVTCAPGDQACLAGACDPQTGQCQAVPLPAGSTCSDGDACSVADFCSGGQCQAGVDTCPCKSQADCAGLEDGRLCNGRLFCDLGDHTCKLNPKTVVSCGAAGDSACQKNLCDPKVGKCSLQPAAGGRWLAVR